MFRLWAKEILDNRMIKDITVADEAVDTRTHKVFRAIDKICVEFDLAKPIWLDSNISEFKKTSKTRFTKDSFIEEISFDYLEIQIIEED